MFSTTTFFSLIAATALLPSVLAMPQGENAVEIGTCTTTGNPYAGACKLGNGRVLLCDYGSVRGDLDPASSHLQDKALQSSTTSASMLSSSPCRDSARIMIWQRMGRRFRVLLRTSEWHIDVVGVGRESVCSWEDSRTEASGAATGTAIGLDDDRGI